jgi:hypothetical protein
VIRPATPKVHLDALSTGLKDGSVQKKQKHSVGGGRMNDHEVEAVARAFYAVTDGARGWDREPDMLKNRFRADARAAIAALDEYSDCEPEPDNWDALRPSQPANAEQDAKQE